VFVVESFENGDKERTESGLGELLGADSSQRVVAPQPETRSLAVGPKLDRVIDQTTKATAGREAVQGLRSSAVETEDLAFVVTALAHELSAVRNGDTNKHTTAVRVYVGGMPRSLHPILRDEVYRVAEEALCNAFRHAHAQRIEVEIRFDDRQFQVRVRDDGKGIDQTVLDKHWSGHSGLPGMRERAEFIGGHLDVWSNVGLGTEVDLTVPARAAYVDAKAEAK